LSIIKHVTLHKIVAHDFQYDPRIIKSRPTKTLTHTVHVNVESYRLALCVSALLADFLDLECFDFKSLLKWP
jgi:hypothetical protein